MSDDFDPTSIHWITSEINVNIDDTQQLLEVFLTAPEDLAPLVEAIDKVHQIYGTLQIVEIYSIANLAEELEKTLIALENKQLTFDDKAYQALIPSLIALPQLLSEYTQSNNVSSVSAVPHINRLRTLRNEKPIESPAQEQSDYKQALDNMSQGIESSNTKKELELKLLQLFQHAFVNFSEKREIQKNCSFMEQSVLRLQKIYPQKNIAPLWAGIHIILKSVDTNPLETMHLTYCEFFGRINRLIKYIVNQKDSDKTKTLLRESFIAALKTIQNLETSTPESIEFASKYKDVPQLENMLTANGNKSLNVKTIQALAQAIYEEISYIKDVLDIINRNNNSEMSHFIEIVPRLKQISDILIIISLDIPRQAINEQLLILDEIITKSAPPSEDTLIELASVLLYTEASIRNFCKFGDTHQNNSHYAIADFNDAFSHGLNSVAREVNIELNTAKQLFVDHVQANWSGINLNTISDIFRTIYTILDFVDLKEPLNIFELLDQYIHNSLINSSSQPNWQNIDLFADTVSALDHYFVNYILTKETKTPFLDLAEHNISALLTSSSEPADNSSDTAKVPSSLEEPLLEEPLLEEPLLEEPLLEEPLLEEPLLEEPLAEEPLAEEPLAEEPLAEEPLAEEPLAEEPPLEEPVDEEILEIFFEEVSEIVAEVEPLLAQLTHQPDNIKTCEMLRRNFHTLKGSGRMAQVKCISEPAFEIENHWNYLLDNKTSPSQQFLRCLQDFIIDIPEILEIYTKSPNSKELNDRTQNTIQYIIASTQNLNLLKTVDSDQQEDTTDNSDASQHENSFDGILYQELASHFDFIKNYIDVNFENPQEAPKSETLLRSIHTLKGLLASHEQDSLKKTLEHFERIVREAVALEMFRSTEFFYHLDTVINLLTPSILDNTFNRDNIDLAQLTESVNNFEETLILSADNNKKPQLFNVEWLNECMNDLEFLIKNSKVKQPQDLSADHFTALENIKQSAENIKLLEVVQFSDALLAIYKFYNSNIDFSEHNISFLIQKSHESLMTFSDAIALNQESDYLEQITDELLHVAATLEEQVIEQDSELNSVFIVEMQQILKSISFHISSKVDESQFHLVLAELQRDYHTIKGGAYLANLNPIGDLAKESELLCERFTDKKALIDQGFIELLQDTQVQLHAFLECLVSNIALEADLKLISRIQNTQPMGTTKETDTHESISTIPDEPETHKLADTNLEEIEQELIEEQELIVEADLTSPIPLVHHFNISPDNEEIIEIFFEEVSEIFDDAHEDLSVLSSSNLTAYNFEQAQNSVLRALHTLKGGARLAQLPSLASMLHLAEEILEPITVDDLPQRQKASQLIYTFLDLITAASRQFNDGNRVFSLNSNNQTAIDNNQQSLDSDQFKLSQPNPNTRTQDTQIPLDSHSSTDQMLDTSVDTPNIEAENTASEEKINNPNALSPVLDDQGLSLAEFDQEILEIFLEESNELAEELDRSMIALKQNAANEENLDQLKRTLHTLKGGARLAGFSDLGNKSHIFESWLEEHSSNPEASNSISKHITEAINQHNQLVDVLESIAKSINAHLNGESLVEPTTAQHLNKTESNKPESANQNNKQDQPIPQIQSKVARRRKNTEVIRIGADTLDRLVNLAGETVISRSSVQQELSAFSNIIEEFSTTLDKVRDKIRNFESETESRMISNNERLRMHEHRSRLAHETVGNDFLSTSSEFDSLEMDRFSGLHQLARSLSESASDLMDMKETLTDRLHATESLVLQQSRVQTQLQEGLMQSRMVPFSRLAPRLHRMTRQIADELGKQAELEIVNAEGEMDRSMLERMVPPLEHMLRNSLDHGIEMPNIRHQRDKNPVGRITLHLSREGNEIVLRLSDDGNGISVEHVRRKAIQLDFINEDSGFTENEILQFIFKPGFSTAQKVTQISGRGVGLDVVYSEIKQLNGSLKIHSSEGTGTQFTIRLPFTVSVSRALMVKCGDDTYAIPLMHIEGVVRISPYELNSYLKDPAKKYRYAEKDYDVKTLSNYLGSSDNAMAKNQFLPLILARSTERSVAVQVDSLIGSREVVVKSVGPQLEQVIGLSGATILGDGSVVIILDLNSLIRSDADQLFEQPLTNTITPVQNIVRSSSAQVVMVVDDSVTVRKVTSRLLERHGLNVITAKDGLDAVTQLRDHQPDLMLLDIEMPRMDGFEVAAHVRHDPNIADLPIIMISSRTGQKHRQRLESLGVNAFLGKPYQEIELLNEIDHLLGITAHTKDKGAE